MRHYYLKNGKQAYSLKQSIENYPEIDATGLVEVTEEEWNALNPIPVEPTEAQIKEQKRLNKISSLKRELASYDYIGVKIATGVATIEEYAEQIALAEELRAKLRELLEQQD